MNERFDQAVRTYWNVTEAQAAKQLVAGKIGAGSRGAVTGGAHLDAIGTLLEDVFVAAGFPRTSVKRSAGIGLPALP